MLIGMLLVSIILRNKKNVVVGPFHLVYIPLVHMSGSHSVSHLILTQARELVARLKAVMRQIFVT